MTGSANPLIPGEDSCGRIVPGYLPRPAVVAAESIHKTGLQPLAEGLSELLQEPVTALPLDSLQASMPDALYGAQTDSQTVALDLSPVAGHAFLIFPRTLLFRVLDILLASPEMAPAGDMPTEPVPDEDIQVPEPRSVTSIELYILREWFEIFARSLRDAWEPFCPAGFHLMPFEAEDAEASAAPVSDDLALVLRATIELAGSAADVSLVIPAYLARFAELKSRPAGSEAFPTHISEELLTPLGNATLRMEAVMEGASLRVRDLLDLTPGRILILGDPGENPFNCLVNGVPQFNGELMGSGGRCCIRIGNTLPEPKSSQPVPSQTV